jgi:hypothetical protein
MQQTIKTFTIMDLERFRSKIITVRGQQVILDNDIADLYKVETKRINEAVKNNPDKFPEGYIFTLTDEEMHSLRSKFSTLKSNGRGQHTKYNARCASELCKALHNSDYVNKKVM